MEAGVVQIPRRNALQVANIELAVRRANSLYLRADGYLDGLFMLVDSKHTLLESQLPANGKQKLMKPRIVMNTLVLVHRPILREHTQFSREQAWEYSLGDDPVPAVKDKYGVQQMKSWRTDAD